MAGLPIPELVQPQPPSSPPPPVSVAQQQRQQQQPSGGRRPRGSLSLSHTIPHIPVETLSSRLDSSQRCPVDRRRGVCLCPTRRTGEQQNKYPPLAGFTPSSPGGRAHAAGVPRRLPSFAAGGSVGRGGGLFFVSASASCACVVVLRLLLGDLPSPRPDRHESRHLGRRTRMPPLLGLARRALLLRRHMSLPVSSVPPSARRLASTAPPSRSPAAASDTRLVYLAVGVALGGAAAAGVVAAVSRPVEQEGVAAEVPPPRWRTTESRVAKSSRRYADRQTTLQVRA